MSPIWLEYQRNSFLSHPANTAHLHIWLTSPWFFLHPSMARIHSQTFFSPTRPLTLCPLSWSAHLSLFYFDFDFPDPVEWGCGHNHSQTGGHKSSGGCPRRCSSPSTHLYFQPCPPQPHLAVTLRRVHAPIPARDRITRVPVSTIVHHSAATVAIVVPTPQIAHSAAAAAKLPYIRSVRIPLATIVFGF